MIIKQARVIDPSVNFDQITDILVKDGRIAEIGSCLEAENEDILDAKGLCAAPGFVDVHTHFREPGFTHKEDITTGSKAALRGGYTSIVMMANTKPAIDDVQPLSYVMKRASEQPVHVYASANVTKGLLGKERTDFVTLAKAGCVGFTDDGIPIMDEKLLEEAFVAAKKLNMPVSLHEENPNLITENGINAGETAKKLGLTGSPREAEISMIERDLKLAVKTGAIVNIQHISTKEGVELVRQAKKMSSNIHAEACPHHFALTESAVLEHGTMAKMNPPLRLESDRQAIIAGLRDGTIDLIATDHAPHAKEEKEQPFSKAPSGIIGLETALSLGITRLVKEGHLTLSELIEHMSTAPARMYGFEAGTLKVGSPADIVIFDENEEYVVGEFASKSSNSPFIGQTLTGKVKYTMCGGKLYEAF